jgi:photosynthetic reaction center cytochrome c subunit
MGGFARAMGQRCTFCHVAGDWPKDDKTPKLVARQMIQLVEATNSRLHDVRGLRTADPQIGCNTCHRGNSQPAP